jgi:hypothetical protein
MELPGWVSAAVALTRWSVAVAAVPAHPESLRRGVARSWTRWSSDQHSSSHTVKCAGCLSHRNPRGGATRRPFAGFRLNPGAGISLKPDTSPFAKVCWASDADRNNSAATANDASDAPYVGMALYLLLRVTWAVGDFCSPAYGCGIRSRYTGGHVRICCLNDMTCAVSFRAKSSWPAADAQRPTHWYSTSGRPALPYRERRRARAESARYSK